MKGKRGLTPYDINGVALDTKNGNKAKEPVTLYNTDGTPFEFSGGGGTSAVSSVNGKTGVVTITAEELGAITVETDPIYIGEKSTLALNSTEDTNNFILNNGDGTIINIPKIKEKNTMLIANFSGSIIINSNSIYNFNQNLSVANITQINTNGYTFFGSGSSRLLKFPLIDELCNYQLQLTLNGTIGGANGTAREFKIQIQRQTPTIFTKSTGIVKVDNNNLVDRNNPAILTFTNGIDDPFSTNGIQIQLNNTTTQNVTITSFTLNIQGSRN